ncbi:MAG: PstS family phosphate ABC transporter substrate-binding protein [Bacteroidia bacterium]|nr:PstS family phosphate ABC transporter substrate-binding protein [Bacteroidia bacterium]
MKKKIYLLLTASVVLFAFTQTKLSIKIKGSDTVLPLSQKEAETFMASSKDASVTVTGGGSGVGITALVDGTTDIAMSSRKIKLTEKMKLQDAGKAIKETIIAYDALAVIVNPGSSISQLTREQLEDIYTGKATNWKQVGGEDLKITVYSRESSSGTFEFFKESVMKNKNYAASALMMPATGAIVQSVSQTKGAIGYVGLAYIEKEVKALGVSYDKGKTFIKPTVAAAKDKSYPITRPLYYYYLVKDANKVKPLVDYILSDVGQKVVSEVGYVPLK